MAGSCFHYNNHQSLSGGKQEQFCYQRHQSGFALSRDIHLGCHSQLLPKQPLGDAAVLTNIKGAELSDLECDTSPGLGKQLRQPPPQRWGRMDMQESCPQRLLRSAWGTAALPLGGFVMGMLGRELIALKAISSPFIWSLGDLNGGLLTPPAQSSQQLLSQVPANRSTCLWSQSGPSGDQAPFPRLIGVRRVENVTPLPFLKGLFKAGCKPLILLLLLWVSFSASFPPHTPSQVVLKVNMQSFFLWDAGANPHC